MERVVKPVFSNASWRIDLTLDGSATLVSSVQLRTAVSPLTVTPDGIASAPLGQEVLPVMLIVDPSLVKLRLVGIQTAYKTTSLASIDHVASGAWLVLAPLGSGFVVHPAKA